MVDDRSTALLAHAIELERRDTAVAAELATIEGLMQRVAALRAQAADVGAQLGALPDEQAAAASAEVVARSAQEAAVAALEVAEARVAALERARRPRQDELDQAGRELVRAREDLHDTGVRVDRIVARRAELDGLERTLREAADALTTDAHAVADEIGPIAYVTDAGKGDPGVSLDELERWGAQARAALFVARGTLASQRERIVIEANTLGSAVLGEPLGASSVALVRRRLEQALVSS